MEITKELKQKWLGLLEKVKVNELSPRDIIAIIQEDLHNIEGQNIPIRLRIEYTDGDSFRSYEEIDDLDYIWYNYKIAETNLQAIKKHSELLSNLCWGNTAEREKLLNKAKKEWWFVEDRTEDGILGKDLYENSIYLLKDNGETFQYSTPWTGYFASLQDVKIIIAESA